MSETRNVGLFGQWRARSLAYYGLARVQRIAEVSYARVTEAILPVQGCQFGDIECDYRVRVQELRSLARVILPKYCDCLKE